MMLMLSLCDYRPERSFSIIKLRRSRPSAGFELRQGLPRGIRDRNAVVDSAAIRVIQEPRERGNRLLRPELRRFTNGGHMLRVW
jgi:hypothetical protein